MINACKSQNINSVWPVWLTKTYSKKTASLNHSMFVHKLLYTSPIIFKPKTQTHNTFMICLVQKKEELKNPRSEMEKRKAKTHSLKKRKKFSSHFRVQKYSLPVCFVGRERETVWENYWPLQQAKKKKEILRLFFFGEKRKVRFFYMILWEREENLKNAEKKSSSCSCRQAGRQAGCATRRRGTLLILC